MILLTLETGGIASAARSSTTGYELSTLRVAGNKNKRLPTQPLGATDSIRRNWLQHKLRIETETPAKAILPYQIFRLFDWEALTVSSRVTSRPSLSER